MFQAVLYPGVENRDDSNCFNRNITGRGQAKHRTYHEASGALANHAQKR